MVLISLRQMGSNEHNPYNCLECQCIFFALLLVAIVQQTMCLLPWFCIKCGIAWVCAKLVNNRGSCR